MEDPNANDRCVLFTNLEYVTIGEVRTKCCALLLELRSGRCTMAGFGPDPSWPVFDMPIKSVDHKLEQLMINAGERGQVPSISSRLVVAGGVEVLLSTMDWGQPLCVETFTAVDINRVWETLLLRTSKYWKAPNMPTLRWMPASQVREMMIQVVAEMNRRQG